MKDIFVSLSDELGNAHKLAAQALNEAQDTSGEAISEAVREYTLAVSNINIKRAEALEAVEAQRKKDSSAALEQLNQKIALAISAAKSKTFSLTNEQVSSAAATVEAASAIGTKRIEDFNAKFNLLAGDQLRALLGEHQA